MLSPLRPDLRSRLVAASGAAPQIAELPAAVAEAPANVVDDDEEAPGGIRRPDVWRVFHTVDAPANLGENPAAEDSEEEPRTTFFGYKTATHGQVRTRIPTLPRKCVRV